MKLGEWWKKLWWRSPHDGEDDESGDSVNETFSVSKGESYSSWIPSQQDRPRH
jgi:hypothetical protein